ncbi:hypothetical protein CL656_01700 [bacterium]|nr:hypothetical protein [bacterium]|tara:strand:- start:2501 stop:2809 length:309 start_codon:yes stop_codon:yes gene_type:complete
MEYITKIERRFGVDVGFNESNLHPKDGEGRVGKGGIDKNYTLNDVLKLAYKMDEKPNIIVRGGSRSKWYLKRFPLENLEKEIVKQKKWRDCKVNMWIIEWEN